MRARGFSITRNARFVDFVGWWGPTRQVISSLGADWRCTSPLLIHGFLDRSMSVNLLEACEVGTFLVRFSAGYPGKLVISFNDEINHKRQHQHVLVEISDSRSIADPAARLLSFSITFDDGRRHNYRSLADLILSCRRLTKILSDGVEHPKEAVFRPCCPEPLGC